MPDLQKKSVQNSNKRKRKLLLGLLALFLCFLFLLLLFFFSERFRHRLVKQFLPAESYVQMMEFEYFNKTLAPLFKHWSEENVNGLRASLKINELLSSLPVSIPVTSSEASVFFFSDKEKNYTYLSAHKNTEETGQNTGEHAADNTAHWYVSSVKNDGKSPFLSLVTDDFSKLRELIKGIRVTKNVSLTPWTKDYADDLTLLPLPEYADVYRIYLAPEKLLRLLGMEESVPDEVVKSVTVYVDVFIAEDDVLLGHEIFAYRDLECIFSLTGLLTSDRVFGRSGKKVCNITDFSSDSPNDITIHFEITGLGMNSDCIPGGSLIISITQRRDITFTLDIISEEKAELTARFLGFSAAGLTVSTACLPEEDFFNSLLPVSKEQSDIGKMLKEFIAFFFTNFSQSCYNME